ncbi:MAG: hypothetical protein ACOH18_00215 [Candidatus Saccharimonadaceae bacterium]
MTHSENTKKPEPRIDLEPTPPREVSMAETDMETIDTQIAEGLRSEEAGGELFLNNFHLNFEGGLARNIVKKYDLQDVPMVSADEATVLSGNADSAYRYSDHALATTWGSFFEEIDEILEKTGLLSDEVARLRTIQRQTFTEAGLSAYILPVYRELRMRGYAHGELMR